MLLSTAARNIGYYSWEFAEDLVRIDRVCACIFDFDATDASRGLPIMAFIDKMDSNTRERIAAAIFKSITQDEYYDETYTILVRGNRERWVRVTGRCMLNEDGLPTHSAGTMTDVTHLRASY